MRLAWFSPVPPVRSGVAGRSAELIPALRQRGAQIDIYVDGSPSPAVASAHDFPWRHRKDAYDLAVYQFGNSSHHDYVWPYALHYPGLVVLHDTHLHHARAAALLREKRISDYRAEFAWNHPALNADLAELAVRGFDSTLYYDWPMARALVETSRLVAVHGDGAAAELKASIGDAGDDRIVSIRLGEGDTLTPEREAEARRHVRSRYGIPDEAVLFGCLGGLTPEKRVPQILDAFRAILPSLPSVRLLLAGAAAGHFDVAAEISRRFLDDVVTLTGYLENDADLTDHLAACDVSLHLRWPTARETSGPWLRALAAARPTIITDLIHQADVPSLDPRTWRANTFEGRGPRTEDRGPRTEDRGPGTEDRRTTTLDPRPSTLGARPSTLDPRTSDPVCIALDILDEDHSLRLAMRRLATDPDLRSRLGRNGRAWWAREHSVDVMVDDYLRVIDAAIARPVAAVELPPHLRHTATSRLRALVAPFGLERALSADGLLE